MPVQMNQGPKTLIFVYQIASVILHQTAEAKLNQFVNTD